MTVTLFPKTKLGTWSIILIAATPVLLFIGSSFRNLLYESVSAGETILEDVLRRPVLAITMILGMAAGVGVFITGIFAIAKDKERALLVYVSTIMGLLFTLFLIAGFMFTDEIVR